jgi:hypothetical protein
MGGVRLGRDGSRPVGVGWVENVTRTFGLIQAGPCARTQASLEGLFIWRCSPEDRRASARRGWAGENVARSGRSITPHPRKDIRQAWRGH